MHVDPTGDPASWREAAAWMPSSVVLGTPGLDDKGNPPSGGWQIPGDANQDTLTDLSDAVTVLRFLFLGGDLTLPCGDGTLGDEGNRQLLDSNADGAVDIGDAVSLLGFLFLHGSPPALGVNCIRIEDCPTACAP